MTIDGRNQLDRIRIGNVFQDKSGITYVAGENVETVWQGELSIEWGLVIYAQVTGLVPYDGVPIAKVVTVHLAVTCIYIPLACAGIVFAITCLLFNFLYRNAK